MRRHVDDGTARRQLPACTGNPPDWIPLALTELFLITWSPWKVESEQTLYSFHLAALLRGESSLQRDSFQMQNAPTRSWSASVWEPRRATDDRSWPRVALPWRVALETRGRPSTDGFMGDHTGRPHPHPGTSTHCPLHSEPQRAPLRIRGRTSGFQNEGQSCPDLLLARPRLRPRFASLIFNVI